MAYDFTSTSSQYMSAPSLNISGYPYTISCWARVKSDNGQSNAVFGFGNTSNGHRAFLFFEMQVAGDPIALGLVGVSATAAIGSITASLNTWQHVCGVFTNSTLRTLYVDGALAATNTATVTQTLGTPTVQIAARNNGSSYGLFFNGLVADAGIYDAALTADEIASLAKGMTCDKVRPQSLVYYAPLVRDLIDAKGGLTITNNNGATVANHPRVYA
jgi:hypothetical protein